MEPIKLFISYALEDESHVANLIAHLSGLRNQGKIDILHRGDLTAGAELASAIPALLNEAKIILLLLSHNYNNWNDTNEEMQQALKLRQEKKIYVVPVLLRPIDVASTPIGMLKIKTLPKSGQAILSQDDQDGAYLEVVQEIKQILNKLNSFLERKFIIYHREVTSKYLLATLALLMPFMTYSTIRTLTPDIEMMPASDSFTTSDQWALQNSKWNAINNPGCLGRQISGHEIGLFKTPDSSPFNLYQDFDLVTDWELSETCLSERNSSLAIEEKSHITTAGQLADERTTPKDSKEFAWVIRAQNQNNYYLFRLEAINNKGNIQTFLHFSIHSDTSSTNITRPLPDKIDLNNDSVTIITKARKNTFTVTIQVNNSPQKKGFETNETFTDIYDHFQHGAIGLAPIKERKFFIRTFIINPQPGNHPIIRRLQRLILSQR
ncbi:MAG: toll/interleukin-1 receptor domain-containing protein [Blastocatellia bacterium]|nr:toll/interleukin-1 receptor domain-containing protein [Blastocatellia bacterium]